MMAWTQKLPDFPSADQIFCLNSFEGKLYAGTGNQGDLLEWDNVSATWAEVASGAGFSITSVNDLIQYNGKLYGCGGGKLLEWNGSNAWVSKASGASGVLKTLCVYGGSIFASGSAGILYEWAGSGNWVQRAPLFDTLQYVRDIIVFNNKIYGSTSRAPGLGGKLLEWNGTNAWVEVADTFNSGVIGVFAMVELGGELYGCTGDTIIVQYPAILKWNGTDAWVEVARIPDFTYGVQDLFAMEIVDNKIYAAGQGSDLWRLDGGSLTHLFNETGTGNLIENCLHIHATDFSLYGATGFNSILYDSGIKGTPPPSLDYNESFNQGDIWLHLVNGISTIEILNNDLRRDPTLETAILISLFTDARAADIDSLPDNSGEKNGWWADDENDPIGSKLWLLFRSSTTEDIPARAEQRARESLQWLLDDGVAASLEVTAERTAMETLSLSIVIQEPEQTGETVFKYEFNWKLQAISEGR